jgi:hypothetical protein
MRKADDYPSVNVPSRADLIVHYTIKSTVNGHVDLFSHQWFLIHGSTPFTGSVTAW